MKKQRREQRPKWSKWGQPERMLREEVEDRFGLRLTKEAQEIAA